MMRKSLYLAFMFSILGILAFPQDHYSRFQKIDIEHYRFEIHLNDSTDRIEGLAKITLRCNVPVHYLNLDLVKTNETNLGMKVNSILQDGKELSFLHENHQLSIQLNKKTTPGQIIHLQVSYSGIPVDGLVISKNKHNQRTFFGDNWPDRARHWLPTVDHPSDKATIEFLVYAPEHYEIVSNGYLVEKKSVDDQIEFTHWKTDVPIPTKLMVIGAAGFYVGNKSTYKNIPVSSWVFENDKNTALQNYRYGTEALQFFSELIGPYPYEKLAHVQSKTRYGGMENASCIFYHENTATGNRSQERLFAHEVAHQWFGNSVSEQNWHHVWLSEGFATYLTHVYQQHYHGEKIFRAGLKNDRERIIQYAKIKAAPVIDTTVHDFTKLLNTNSYQKASWILHMLREELGDATFFAGLRKYYSDYQNSTALTTDFQRVMEAVSGKDLDQFFHQWLWQAGHPVLNYNWKQENDKIISFRLNQTQHSGTAFSFPLELLIQLKDGTVQYRTIQINRDKSVHEIKVNGRVEKVLPDPDTKLLFELSGNLE